jgi:hypothetical protein
MIALRERLMSETRGFLRRWGGVVAVVVLLFLAVLALTGCAEPAAIAAIEPTPTLYPPPPTDIPPPPPGPTPVALDFPLPAPTGVDEERPSDQNCVDCHTDEETLKAVAEKEESSQESLSEGEG